MAKYYEIRPAAKADIPELLRLIHALAEYQHMEDEVTVTAELLETWLFRRHAANVFLLRTDKGKTVGFALYYYMFSAFSGLPGIYLQDLYIDPVHRGNGCGKSLMKVVAQTAVSSGCDRVEWACLDWNQSSIEFYRSLGAKPMEDWTNYHLSGEALQAFGAPV